MKSQHEFKEIGTSPSHSIKSTAKKEVPLKKVEPVSKFTAILTDCFGKKGSSTLPKNEYNLMCSSSKLSKE
jgi:hypothetical protein